MPTSIFTKRSSSSCVESTPSVGAQVNTGFSIQEQRPTLEQQTREKALELVQGQRAVVCRRQRKKKKQKQKKRKRRRRRRRRKKMTRRKKKKKKKRRKKKKDKCNE